MGLETEGMNRALEARWMTRVSAAGARYLRALWRPRLPRREAWSMAPLAQRSSPLARAYHRA